ncbi:GDSL esterase/lipase 5-like isoform X1 [Syzygium oleosum]|uniref:GDSL esterase/lipase 5-like isoform X1 n=1 Tax=Syzygium oleosum TaxID=219896 RepID=UPI0024B8BEF9|nr:GDSL esterase/lipase 5-like isoform X1 [Syzygium oleosum]
MLTPTLNAIFTAAFASLFISIRCDNPLPRDVALFIFGDSINDAGTNKYINTTVNFRANFFPYGETFFHYPTGRFSNGRLIADFIAEYAKLPLIPPYLQMKDDEFMGGANFASAGAGALSDTYEGFVVSFMMQLKQFEKLEKKLSKRLGNEEAKKVIAEAVYLISIRNNDYLTLIHRNLTPFQPSSMEEYVGMVIGNITTVLEGIYKAGGRKFGMIGIKNIGCLPSLRKSTGNGSCLRIANVLAKLHDIDLISILKKLEAQLQGFKYSYFDFYTSARDRIRNPSKYGFKEGKMACCGSGPFRGNPSCGGKRGVKEYSLCRRPEKFLFFDNHPTERANQQYAQLMWNGSSSITGPYNVEELFKLGRA